MGLDIKKQNKKQKLSLRNELNPTFNQKCSPRVKVLYSPSLLPNLDVAVMTITKATRIVAFSTLTARAPWKRLSPS